MNKRKPPSGRKLGSSNLSPPELFIDRSLGRRKVPDRLREVHPRVTAHDEIFAQDTDDEVWLRDIGGRGWVVLTKDERIRRKPGEQRTILRFRVKCFVLHPTRGLTGPEMAEILVKALPRMLRVAQQEKRGGFIKIVDRRGRIRHVLP